MAHSIFIDGESGTTGLQIRDRLLGRDDIALIQIDPERRKDADARREAFAAADIAILEEVQGKWTFDDAGGEIIGGDKALVPVLTFKDGDQFAPDYGPFPWGWLPNPLE